MKNHRGMIAALALVLCACSAVGPRTVERDRIDYGSALSVSLQEQTVLNIVKSRYLDWPTFLDVSQIVAGYSREGSATLGGDWFPNDSSSTNVTPSVTGTFTESPTITYTPLTGKDFASTLLEPLDVEAIFAVAYTGWRVDRLFELTLSSINGHRNAQFVSDDLQPADEGFQRALELFRDLQKADAWSLRRQSDAAKDQKQDQTGGSHDAGLELIFRPGEDASIRKKVDELCKKLGLDATRDTFNVVYSDRAGEKGVLTLESRTLWEVFWELQRFVEPPAEDESAGRVHRLAFAADHPSSLLRIRGGTSLPQNAFVAVPYRGRWFWIDDDDLESKHTLSIVLLMSTLARQGGAEPPELVIPTR